MQRHRILLFLSLLLLSTAQSQDTSTTISPSTTTPWAGDQKLCPTNPKPSPDPTKKMPNFPLQAEFAIERIEQKHLLNFSLPGEISLEQHIYDYNANVAIIVKNKNGIIDAEYFDYKNLRKSTYIGGTYCNVEPIPTDNEMNGGSAVRLPNGTWHLRPLNEYLLFSNIDPSRKQIIPVYLGQGTRRGITVDLWRSCYYSLEDYRTVRRIWAFAASNMSTPFGQVGDGAVPVHAEISASYSLQNGTEVVEFDEIYNIQSYKPGIVESNDQLAPPKGVFCKVDNGSSLFSLKQLNIAWPDRFSVRVDASSSRSPRTQRFHLRYNLGRDGTSRRIRYDYMPPGSEDYRSVIHDYGDALTYSIDRRLGTCEITKLQDLPSVSPIRDPIEFFIKYEVGFIFAPPENAWAFNGYRGCRGDLIRCIIATTAIDSFPPIVDSDTGLPTGETWLTSNLEYSWSSRAPEAPPRPGTMKLFDYPVSLYMRMFRFADPLNPSLVNIRTEDVEYEFFEMAEDLNQRDFDISTCYRSNSYEYLHVFFSVKADKTGVLDSAVLNRRDFERQLVRTIANQSEVKYSRISDIEVEHERVSQNVYVFFTLLGQTRVPETNSFDTTEPTAADAKQKLQRAIDSGIFQLNVALSNGSTVLFRGEPKSLKSSTEYMSTHTIGNVVSTTSYSSGAQAAAIIVGLLIGLVLGVVIAVIVRKARNQPLPSKLTNFSNPLPSINFSTKKPATATSNA